MSEIRHAGRPELSYILTYVKNAGGPRFDVSLCFRGGPSGRTRIVLPSEWAGQKRFYDAIKLARPRSPHVVIQDSRLAHRKIVSHPPNRLVTIRYQLRQTWPGELTDFWKCYWPVLQEEYFHFIGEGFFVHPDWDDERPRTIELRWKRLPEGWTLSNSFGTALHAQVFVKSLRQLRRAVYVGGDFRVKRISVRRRPLYAALRGRWNFPDQAFFSLSKRIVEAERRFWKDYDFPYFLITLIPTSQPRGSYGGTGLTDSVATFVSTDRPPDFALKHLLAHELFHTWNGVKIVAGQPEELLYWFTEGFTEYYTRLLLLRARLITLEEYVDDYNRAILDYYASPFREAGNRKILKRFWHDEHVRRIPYRRGDIIAHNWNARIRIASRGRHSLDDMMTDLLKAAQERDALISPATVGELIRPYLKRGVEADIKKHIDSGALISPEARALGSGVELRMTEVREFDLGFEFAASSAQMHVGTVRKDSNAFRAGLRKGQQVLEARIFHGDPEQAARLRVRDSEGERLVSFYPAAEKLRVPQYVLTGGMSKKDLAAHNLWFGL